MKLKFLGDYKKLEKCVLRTGVPGKWRELENGQKQYRTDDGAILNWSNQLAQYGSRARRRQSRSSSEHLSSGYKKGPSRGRT